jgi:hypothetical protein
MKENIHYISETEQVKMLLMAINACLDAPLPEPSPGEFIHEFAEDIFKAIYKNYKIKRPPIQHGEPFYSVIPTLDHYLDQIIKIIRQDEDETI